MKQIKGLLVFLIIVNIVLLSYMIFFVEPIHEFTYEEYRISQEGENPQLEAELKVRIYPENKEYLDENYVGNMDLNYVYEKLFDFVHKNLTVIQEQIAGLNVTELNNYFEHNKNELKAIAGIMSVQELSILKQNINGKNLEDNNYISAEFDKDSYSDRNTYVTINLKLNYKDNTELYFTVYIANDIITSPMVIFESTNGGVS